MRFLVVLAFVAVAYFGSALSVSRDAVIPMSAAVDDYVLSLIDNEEGVEIDLNEGEEPVEAAPQFILSWQVRRMIRKMQKQMPCGWPEYGIPPLAPYRVNEAEINFKKGILETFDKVFRFKVDGLDKFKIKKFKLNVLFKKITFDFLFNIQASAQKYETDTLVDAMRQMGITVQYEGDGTLGFGLTNLRIAGVLKYKLPVLWGSAKITSLKTTVTLEKCTSEVTGLVGDGSINLMINREIENLVESTINDNQPEISEKIEATVVPKVNKMLKGKDFWTLVDMIFSSDEGEDDPIVTKCVPPPDPWA